MRRTAQAFFLYFVLYSCIGWCYEVFLEVVVYRWGYSDRGVLTGPYCIIYGVGALLLVVCLGRLQHTPIRIGPVSITPVLVFLGIVALTTALELAGSYIMEAATGSWMWDYRRVPFNCQGRVALNPSLRFGVGGMVFLYVLQPLFERLTDRMSPRLLSQVTGVLLFLFVTDVVHFLLT